MNMFKFVLLLCLAIVSAKAKIKNKYSIINKAKYLRKYPSSFTDPSNCIEWTCKDWCILYDSSYEKEYIKYGCVEDDYGCAC